MWQPTPSEELECASSIASSVADAFAIMVALVSTPARCNSTMARLTPGVRPKSSALMMSCLTGQVYQRGAESPLCARIDLCSLIL